MGKRPSLICDPVRNPIPAYKLREVMGNPAHPSTPVQISLSPCASPTVPLPNFTSVTRDPPAVAPRLESQSGRRRGTISHAYSHSWNIPAINVAQ